MNKLKVALLSTVMAVGLGQASHANYTQNDLVTLNNLVASGDTSAVMAYIDANPQLLQGNDPLASVLNEFVSSRGGLLGGIFGQKLPNLARVPSLPDGVTSEQAMASGSLSPLGS